MAHFKISGQVIIASNIKEAIKLYKEQIAK